MENSDGAQSCPDPRSINLKNQCVSILLKKGYTQKEAEFLTKYKFEKLNSLRLINSDKLSYLLNTKDLSDYNIYMYMLSQLEKYNVIGLMNDFSR